MAVKSIKKLILSFTLSCIWLCIAAQSSTVRYAVTDRGVPASPYPITYTQPSGEKLSITLKGDGLLHWAETTDGYKLLRNSEGAWCYAVSDSENGIAPSTIVARNEDKRDGSEVQLLSTINKKAFFSTQLITQKVAYKQNLLKSTTTPLKAFPTSGNRKLLCILVSYSDYSMVKSKNEFNNLFNQKGYSTNGATGSVADYFYDNSFGQMSLSVDVVGPYTLSNFRSYYGSNDSYGQDSRPEEMVAEAVAKANPDVDFSQYDNDKDGYIDGVYVIFAGYGEEAGATAAAIWSHAWRIPTVTYDGVKISSYSCSPELYGNSGSTITGIGVITHEFLHVCGLPDYYDTDYEESGGESPALGTYDVMSSGSWNNNGRTPPYVNAYSRAMLGWGTLASFQPKKKNTLLPHNTSNVGYSVSTITNELYVFENRQKVKWDRFIPGHGMVAYHVVYDKSIWNQNIINNNPAKEYFMLVDAGTNQNSASSTFPGTLNVARFTSKTTPAFVNWDGTSLSMPLDNITETDGVITLDAKTFQYVTFTVKEENLAIANAEIVVDGKKYYTGSNGSVSVEASLLGDRSYSVNKLGYKVETGTITSDNDTNITIALVPSGEGKFIRLLNGTTPLSNVKVSLYGVTKYSDSNGLVGIPLLSDATISPSFEFDATNSYSYSVKLSTTSATTDISFKKVVVSSKSRVGTIPTAYVQVSSYITTPISGNSTVSGYIPMSISSTPYTISIGTLFSQASEITPTSTPVDTVKLWYNVYNVSVLCGGTPASNTVINGSNGKSYLTDEMGTFTAFIPIADNGLTLTPSSARFYDTSTSINNLTTAKADITISLVSRLNEELFAVAPNPAINKTIYLYFKGNTGVAYLYNLQGKLLQAYPIVNGQNILQYSTLDKGIYLIKVNAETSNQTQKIIVL